MSDIGQHDQPVDLAHLGRMVQAAFPTKPVPRSHEIVDLPFPYESTKALRYTDDEAEQVRSFFDRTSWIDLVGHLPNSLVVQNAFIFLLPSAARYYLPAFITTVANDMKGARAATEALFSQLTSPKCRSGLAVVPRPAAQEIQEKWDVFMQGFNDRQIDAIASFLSFSERQYGALQPDIAIIRRGHSGFVE